MNLSSNTIGLLIQGPMISIGQGASDFKAYSDKNLKIFNHNCETSITQNINIYKKLFNEIIISTWDNEVITLEFENFCKNNNIKIYQFKKNQDLILGKKVINDQYTRYFNNLIQYEGCYLGIKYILNSDYVIKIRTDQVINIEDIVKQIINSNKKIYVPAMYYKEKYFQIEDFYFAGKKDLLENFFKIASKNLYHRSADR